MELVNYYTQYTTTYGTYLKDVEHLVETDFKEAVEAELTAQLTATREVFEMLMTQISSLEVEQDQEENLKDLKYLVMDALFLAGDLEQFYKHQEIGRVKMRVLNALNKKRRAEAYGNFSSEGGSCPMNQ